MSGITSRETTGYFDEAYRDYGLQNPARKLDHYLEWPNAILAGRQASSSCEVAGPLTEIVMLGTIAQRVPGRRLVWDAAKLRFDDPAATTLVRRRYRKGWEIDTLRT